MDINIVQKSDFEKFKSELTAYLKQLIRENYSMSSTKEWLTEKEACKFLGLSKSTIQKYRKDGTLSFSQHGNKIYFKLEDIQIFLNLNYINNGIK
jgi:excisionase family DNA binding protein